MRFIGAILLASWAARDAARQGNATATLNAEEDAQFLAAIRLAMMG